MSTPAEELRAAAAKLRETAAKAPPGPWGFVEDLYWDRSAITRETGPDEHFWAALVMDVHSTGEYDAARWAALASPALTEPLAAWLEDFARWYDQSVEVMLGELCHGDGCEGPVEDCDCFDKALAVARVITGGAP